MNDRMSRRVRAPRQHRSVRNGIATAAVGAFAVSAASLAQAQLIATRSTADAEIREVTPEFTRGNTSNYVSGTGQNELQLSSIPNAAGVISSASSNRNVALVKFHVPESITTSADLLNYADLRVFFRPNSMNGAGSIRVYGLKPTATLSGTWNEDNVMYRDAGDHQMVNVAVQQGGQSLTSPSVLSQPAPPNAPITPVVGYNADANHSRRAPGIRYENAPLSNQVIAENNARFTWNQSHPSQLLPYIAQPAYNVGRLGESGGTLAVPTALTAGDGDPTTMGDGFTDIYNDVPNTNRPLFSGTTQTWVDDLIAADVTYLGYSQVTFPSNTAYTGQWIGLGLNAPTFAGTSLNNDTPTADMLAARLALVTFIGTYLDLGFRDLTFLIGSGIGTVAGGGPERINGANLQIASKEFQPTGGAVGDFAPQLTLAPEPGVASLAVLGLAALTARGRRR